MQRAALLLLGSKEQPVRRDQPSTLARGPHILRVATTAIAMAIASHRGTLHHLLDNLSMDQYHLASEAHTSLTNPARPAYSPAPSVLLATAGAFPVRYMCNPGWRSDHHALAFDVPMTLWAASVAADTGTVRHGMWRNRAVAMQ